MASDRSELLARGVRAALGAYNDPGPPVVHLVHDVVARLDAALSAQRDAEAALAKEQAAHKATEQAWNDSDEAITKKLDALAPHGTCGCYYDKPGDVCLHHSPKLLAAERRVEELEGALRQLAAIVEAPNSPSLGDLVQDNPVASAYDTLANAVLTARALLADRTDATPKEGA